MKKALNHYRVTDRGYTIARQIKDHSDAVNVVEFLLNTRGFNLNELGLSDKELITFLFKPNKYDVRIHSYPSKQIVEIDHPDDELVNTILTKLKIFNGTALKYNALDLLKPRYRPSDYQPPDVRFAQSVNWGKGKSVIFANKHKERQLVIDHEGFNRVNQLNKNHGTISDIPSIEGLVRRSLSQAKPSEVYRQLKGQSSLSNNQLNKLIYKCQHP